ncbi:MAG: hypothetical protein DWI04_07185 [Planctomycetota bacterium]|jgi:hypothetical protein|nr:MAG: hypothetical protein DWI04_07185 [Planctomycetota bacterium]
MLHQIRFFTQEEAVEKYHMPPSIAAKVFRSLRSFQGSCGNPVYAELEIDAAIRKYLTPSDRVGRKITTNDYGQLAKKLKNEGSSWSEVAKAVNEKYGTTYNATSMRRCVERVNDRKSGLELEEEN